MFIVFKFHQLKFLLSPLCVLFSDNWIPSWSVVSSITSAMDMVEFLRKGALRRQVLIKRSLHYVCTQ